MTGVKKAKKLSNVKVKFISILTDETKPSNMAGAIVKSDNSAVINCNITKSDEIKGLLYVEPMIALKADTDDEYYENEDVEKAAHQFLKFEIENPSDVNHDFNAAKGVKVVESYVDKSEDNWVWKAVLDISENEELMEKAKDNKINGVSIGGTAITSVVDNPVVKGGKMYSLLDMLRNAFKEKMNIDWCWLEDVLVDGTAIFEAEVKTGDNYEYKYYKQAYSIVDGKVELIGEAKEVVEVSSYIEKSRQEKNKKKGIGLVAQVNVSKEDITEIIKQEIALLKEQPEEPTNEEGINKIEKKKISLSIKKTEV